MVGYSRTADKPLAYQGLLTRLVTDMRLIRSEIVHKGKYTTPPPLPAGPHIDYAQSTDNIATPPFSLSLLTYFTHTSIAFATVYRVHVHMM